MYEQKNGQTKIMTAPHTTTTTTTTTCSSMYFSLCLNLLYGNIMKFQNFVVSIRCHKNY